MDNTVLLLEDDMEIIPIIKYILEETGCRVVLSTVRTYMNDIAACNPGVILLDYWMNEKLGSLICTELKAHPLNAEIPVILISAMNGLKQIAVSCKADDFLAKPFDIQELETKVLKWLV